MLAMTLAPFVTCVIALTHSVDTATVATSTASTLDDALLDLGELLDIDVAELAPGVAEPEIPTPTVPFVQSERFPAVNPGAPIWPVSSSTGTPTFDIPLSEDPRVDLWVTHLVGRGRWTMERWLSRLTKFAPLFFEILDRNGVPRDLIFLSMIESGFAPLAYSWAHAVGPWQFIPATARRYGLEVAFWIDERRDFQRSTDAAARYLKDLHAMFGDWHLAWAAYNAGEWKVQRAIKRLGTEDFWRISRTRQLRRETQHYVPKLIAAAIVAKNSLSHGFDRVPYESPLEWDELDVEDATRLDDLARVCGFKAEHLRLLNPGLYRGYTPPERWSSVRVPRGAGALCRRSLSLVPQEQRLTYRAYVPQRNDTVEKVAELCRTTPNAILELNKIDATQISMFDAIIVPVPWAERAVVRDAAPDREWNSSPPFAPGGQEAIIHVVRSGESLWRIAQRYRSTVRDLRKWNGFGGATRLRIGQKVRILMGRR
ncbi:MAG: transglycosylase SLT domain-containing protein [Deltaproteobacteria bacterium]|nr:transglycosylase SLT domain-containing protein [Deltaproteobacteria bacterium]